MFDPDKSYSIGVWGGLTFFVIDTETDEPITNEDGTVKLFHADNYDYSYLVDNLCDGLDVDDLEEKENA